MCSIRKSLLKLPGEIVLEMILPVAFKHERSAAFLQETIFNVIKSIKRNLIMLIFLVIKRVTKSIFHVICSTEMGFQGEIGNNSI